jgi:outer membrane receptor protein involved in Fe transport
VREIERADVSASDFEVRTSGERFLGRSKLEVGVDVNGRFDLTALDVNVLYDRTGAVATTRENISVDGAHRLDRALYASLDSSLLPRLGAGLGARIDRVTTRTPGGFFGERSTAHTAASGFASLSAGPIRGVTVTGQVASGFRDPTLSDRYFRGPTGRGFVTGSPELGPERSLQLDLAVRYTASRWRLAFYAYDYRIDDLVERFETDTDFFFFRHRGRARLRGAEVEAQAMLAGDVTLQLAALVMRGRALDDDSPLDDVPPPTVSAVLRKDFGRCAFGQLRGAAYARDDRPGPSEFAMPGYLLVDASGGYTFSERLQLRVLARNLLDRAYPVSPDRRAVLAPGLSLLTTAVVSF